LAACTKGAFTVVAATAAAPIPAFLRKSRLFILSGSFHGFRVNIQPNIQFSRHKAIDVYTAMQKKYIAKLVDRFSNGMRLIGL
jgi:hypothetical protein